MCQRCMGKYGCVSIVSHLQYTASDVTDRLCNSMDYYVNKSSRLIIICSTVQANIPGIALYWQVGNLVYGVGPASSTLANTLICSVWLAMIPGNTRDWPNVVLMLAHRLRRWPSISTAFRSNFFEKGEGSD